MSATSTKPSKIKPVVALAIGGIILLLAVSLTVKFLQKKASTSLPQGKLSFTDTKTDQAVAVGGEKLPDTFPKDFPIYPGAKIVSSVSSNGLFVTFTAPDGHGLAKVVPFYKNGLSTNGWTITSSFDSDTIQTWAIVKGTAEGSVSITTSERDPLTIVVTLGAKE